MDFLGQTTRKYNGKLLIRPTREAVRSPPGKLREILRTFQAGPGEVLGQKLNATVRGWANYLRHAASAATSGSVDACGYSTGSADG